RVQVGIAAHVGAALDGGVEVVPGETEADAQQQPAEEGEGHDATLLGGDRLEWKRRLLDDSQPQELALLDGVRQARLLCRAHVGKIRLFVVLHLSSEPGEIDALVVGERRLLLVLVGPLGERSLPSLEGRRGGPATDQVRASRNRRTISRRSRRERVVARDGLPTPLAPP